MKTLSQLFSTALMLGCLAACTPDSSAGTAPQQAAAEASQPYSPPKRYSLGIRAYNYTDRYMDSFEVNGQGAGNLDTSTDTAGGGGTACCVSWLEGSKLPRKISIKWVGGYCMQTLHGNEGESQTLRQSLWKIADVQFNGPVPPDPENFEVHFYRDGHIELAMTKGYSPPRLNLPYSPKGYVRPGIVVNDPPCPADYDSLQAYDNPTRVDATQKAKP